MKTYWTAEIKPRVEANLRAAGIDLKSAAAKTILRFERRINTMIIQADNGYKIITSKQLNHEHTIRKLD
jgi:hypothetical protein